MPTGADHHSGAAEPGPVLPEPGAGSGAGSASSGRLVARNTLALVAADAASKAGLFVLYAVIARQLGRSGFGDYTLAVSLAFLVRAAAFGIDLIISREVARELDNVHGLFWDSIVIKLVMGAAVLAGVGLFAALGDYPDAVVAAVLLIGLSNLIDMLAFSPHAVLKGREEMGPPAKALTLESVAIVLMGSVTLLLLDGGLAALGAVYLVAAFLALAYILHAMRRRGIRPQRRRDTGGVRWLLRAAIPTGVATFFSVALGRLDAVILSVMTQSSAAVGLYGGAYRIFEATLFVNWAFGSGIYPLLSRLDRQTQELRKTFEVSCKAISTLTVALGGAMALFGPTILKILLGAEGEGGGTAARILGGATFLYGIYSVAALTVVGQDRQGAFAWIAGLTLAVNVGLNLVLIPSMGIDGAALAMTAAQALITALMLRAALRETGAVSPVRVLAGPLAGLLGMAAVALVVGPGLAGLAFSVPAYGLGLLAMERSLYPEDLEVFRRALRARRAAA